MKVSDALKTLQKSHEEDILNRLFTVWGEELYKKASENKEIVPLNDYPRPMLKREDFHCLNGFWNYEITKADSADKPFKSGEILVPFSPETYLSFVEHILLPDEVLTYRRVLRFSDTENAFKDCLNKHCILHFGAVDTIAKVYVDGKLIFEHDGGYLPFSVEITEFVSERPIELKVVVTDATDTVEKARGKQSLHRGGMFYTPQSGIWQSVWYEWVPEKYIMDINPEPDYKDGSVNIRFKVSSVTTPLEYELFGYLEGRGETKVKEETCTHVIIPDEHEGEVSLRIKFKDGEFLPWSPEEPNLYNLHVKYGEDEAFTYFAMRSCEVSGDEAGIARFKLNGKPYFLNGLLDQGYWPESLMTYPSIEALKFDISLAKQKGYNMLRKHIKVEAEQYYYLCDRLGMTVWQDMVNGGGKINMAFSCYLPTALPKVRETVKDTNYKRFSRLDAGEREKWQQDLAGVVWHLKKYPCIVTWVPFNESWGQFNAAAAAAICKAIDPERPVDHASGWYDQGAGDYISDHNYFRKLSVKPDKCRAYVISEFGGYSCLVKGHSSVDRVYGYRKYTDLDVLNADYKKLFEEELFPLIEKGLSGAVYTQVSDIEEEVNGLVTYDRRVIKIK